MSKVNTSFEVKAAGLLSTIQDLGRFGQAQLGVTTGGPADSLAFNWANKLLGNNANASVIEVTMGGLQLICLADSQICITGAVTELTINQQSANLWQVHSVKQGDTIAIEYAQSGLRLYVAVAGGFAVDKPLGSSATVIRECIGGMDGKGLVPGQQLASYATQPRPMLALTQCNQPNYQLDDNQLTLRVVKGYQFDGFSSLQRQRFFSSEYKVSHLADRMGYRLSGPAIEYPSNTMLSEGICAGAIQIPADGQPIILGKDRQTIGGYPKIGSVLSLDLDKLMQVDPATNIKFELIDIEHAHNLLHLAKAKFEQTPLLELDK